MEKTEEVKEVLKFPRKKVQQYMLHTVGTLNDVPTVILEDSERWTEVNNTGFVVYSCISDSEWGVQAVPGTGRYHQIVFKGYDVYMHDSNITDKDRDFDEMHNETIERFETKMKMAAKAFELVPDLIEEATFPEHKRKEYICEMQEKLLVLTNCDLPAIKAKEDWEITIHPNYGGSTSRFCVTRGEHFVSVYLDMHKNMGDHAPYWEVYPGSHGDPERVDADDADGLVKAIEGGLTFREVYPEG